MHEKFLRKAIDEAAAGVRAGAGGPFGALVVRDNKVLSKAHNAVTSKRDPTAHAEILAIRAACEAIGHHALFGAVLYTSCEPCPMCLGAAFWARLSHVYYAATRKEAVEAGFDDAKAWDELCGAGGGPSLPRTHIAYGDSQRPFTAWASSPTRVPY